MAKKSWSHETAALTADGKIKLLFTVSGEIILDNE